MHDNCKTCTYRTRGSGITMCEYINYTREPRGCEPKDCKKLGKYKPIGNKRKNLNDVTIMWEYQPSFICPQGY